MWRSESLLRQTSRPGGPSTILVTICEGRPGFAPQLAKRLTEETADIEVLGVVDGAAEAERLAREVLPDVVLVDLDLREGVEATRRVRSASPGARVVILTTGSGEAQDLRPAMRAGASGFVVVKDEDVFEVAATIRAVARGDLVVPSQLAAFVLDDLADGGLDLNEAEREILAGLADGETNKDLANRLHLSERTVRRRVDDIYSKLHLVDRIQHDQHDQQDRNGR